MKKWIKYFVVVFAVLFFVTGCGEAQKEELAKNWDAVKEEYEKLEKEAEVALSDTGEISQEEIEELVKTVKEKYDVVKGGITKENEAVAKELYKAAHQLELLADKSEEALESDAVKLGQDVQDYIKQHYSDIENDFSTLRNNIEAGVKTIENFTEEDWNNFLGLFH